MALTDKVLDIVKASKAIETHYSINSNRDITSNAALITKSTAPRVIWVETDNGDKTHFMVQDGGSIRLSENSTSVGIDDLIFKTEPVKKHFEIRNPTSLTPQVIAANALTRKDWVEGELAKQVSKTGDTMTGNLKVAAEIQTTTANSFRHVASPYGVFWRQDGTHHYMMVTDKDNQYGNYNTLRPMSMEMATGVLTFGHQPMYGKYPIHSDTYAPLVTQSEYLDVDSDLDKFIAPHATMKIGRYSSRSLNIPNSTVRNSANSIISITPTSAFGFQLAMQSNEKMYMRMYENMNWKSWGEFYTSQNKPTAADLDVVPASDVAVGGSYAANVGRIPKHSGGVLEIAQYIDMHTKDSSSDYDTRLEASVDGSFRVSLGGVGGARFVVGATESSFNSDLKVNGGVRAANPVLGLSAEDASWGGGIKYQSGGWFMFYGGRSNSSLTEQRISMTGYNDTPLNSFRVRMEQGRNPAVLWGNTSYEILHRGNMPTVADLGAVNKSGDTMTGNLFIDRGTSGSEPRNGVMRSGRTMYMFDNGTSHGIYSTMGQTTGSGADMALVQRDVTTGNVRYGSNNSETTLYGSKVVVDKTIEISAHRGLTTRVGGSGQTTAISAEGSHSMMWRMNNSDTKADEFIGIDANSRLIFRQDRGLGNKSYGDFVVYHQNNKPTAAEVGAPTKAEYDALLARVVALEKK